MTTTSDYLLKVSRAALALPIASASSREARDSATRRHSICSSEPVRGLPADPIPLSRRSRPSASAAIFMRPSPMRWLILGSPELRVLVCSLQRSFIFLISPIIKNLISEGISASSASPRCSRTSANTAFVIALRDACIANALVLANRRMLPRTNCSSISVGCFDATAFRCSFMSRFSTKSWLSCKSYLTNSSVRLTRKRVYLTTFCRSKLKTGQRQQSSLAQAEPPSRS